MGGRITGLSSQSGMLVRPEDRASPGDGVAVRGVLILTCHMLHVAYRASSWQLLDSVGQQVAQTLERMLTWAI